jgi:FkbM family methyltransferase
VLRLPIMGRPLRGYWWLPTSRGKVLRVLRGTYEPEQTAHFVRWIGPGATVIDVGAHVGYYTLLASMLAGESGSVWAFEPEPTNAAFLREHMSLNHCRNVHVEELAVSNSSGHARFHLGKGSGTGRLDSTGDVEVRTIKLADFCEARGIRPTALKIDVEGAEAEVLAGARDLIRETRPVIFLSTHGPALHRQCTSWLREDGYTLHPILGRDVDDTPEILALPDAAIA